MKIVTRSLFLLFLLIPVGLSGQTEWQLVWSDEFNADGLPDTAVWSYDNGFARNEEAQWYQEGNAYCKDGKLIIEARKEEGRRNPWYEARSNDWRKKREFIEYTSSCITTAGKKEFLYGRFEVRAKIPVSGGAWPAIWMLPYETEKYGWPKGGEVDIMERLNNDSIAYQTVHSHYTYTLGIEKNPPHGSTAPINRDEFNVYGVDFWPDTML